METRDEVLDLGSFVVGGSYSRPEIAALGGVTIPESIFSTVWSQGIVEFSNVVILFVTLEKEGDYTYDDYCDGDHFWWQSQNRQRQSTPLIQRIIAGDIRVFLFARMRGKLGSVTQPFTYCGALSVPIAEGDKPVTCLYQMLDYIPDASGPLKDIYEWRSGRVVTAEEQGRHVAIKKAPARGQGHTKDVELRLALEAYSMAMAVKHYTQLGYEVEDTSKNHPYDLLCTRQGDSIRVEVKGTVTEGASVLLTVGEVNSARESGVVSHLFIVCRIQVIREGVDRKLSGGELRIVAPWVPDDEDLKPLQFDYGVPGFRG